MHLSATIGMHRRLSVGIFVVGIEPRSAPTTNHYQGSNSLMSLTPFFFSMHINHLRDLSAVR